MPKRVEHETIRFGVRRLLPEGATQSLMAKALSLALARLRDEVPEIDRACEALLDADFVHRSVAAIYCRRSEPTLDKHLNKLREEGRVEDAMVERRTEEAVGGSKPPTYYRVDLLKMVVARVRTAKDDGDDARAKKAQQRHAASARPLEPLTLSSAEAEQLWLTDAQGRVYIEVALSVGNRQRVANIFRKDGRIEILTFRQAVMEREWVDHRAHQKRLALYLGLLDDERQRARRQSQQVEAQRSAARLARPIRTPKTASHPKRLRL